MLISPKILRDAEIIEDSLKDVFYEIDKTAFVNTQRVLSAFQKERVSEAMFFGSSGYGYEDLGRDAIEHIYASVFESEAALVRLEFVNGTHALACALFGCLHPGDKLLSVTGAVYDTLQTVLGICGDEPGNLRQYGVGYQQAEIGEDFSQMLLADKSIRMLYIQRSCGYEQRSAMSIEDISHIVKKVRNIRPDIIVMVDNCYGEFTETVEPTSVGADICAGSLIKNPGGGMALRGGYICGQKKLVDASAARLTAPGIGAECGSTLGQNRSILQGFFVAPHTVSQALKTAVFCSALLEKYGFEVNPKSKDKRSDIIQKVILRSPESLVAFCGGIQAASPVDSYAKPEPWKMPGYESPVVMAAGTFVSGSTSELSCDGPMREPYTAFIQGGLTYEAGKIGIMMALNEMLGK